MIYDIGNQVILGTSRHIKEAISPKKHTLQNYEAQLSVCFKRNYVHFCWSDRFFGKCEIL